MTTTQFPTEFSALLRSLNKHHVEYLLVGGYAVFYHGYPRTTADMDVWIATSENNANRLVAALSDFGFDVPGLSPALLLKEDRIVRMGHPPLRVEILTSISGVTV